MNPGESYRGIPRPEKVKGDHPRATRTPAILNLGQGLYPGKHLGGIGQHETNPGHFVLTALRCNGG
jgi:hypothetical protein